MARAVKQFRYFGDGSSKNYPQVVNNEVLGIKHFINGSIFDNPNNCYPILQLGIQTLPGTKFYVNSSINPIVIGATGIYELNLDNQAEISKITFDQTSMETIRMNDNAYIIIDILYEQIES